MILYSCRVRLAGSLQNEVNLHDVTAPEIILLRSIHGDDAVIAVKETGEDVKRTHRAERERLVARYQSQKVDINKVFGPSHTQLPLTLPDPVDETGEPVVDAAAVAEARESAAALME